MEGKKIIVFGAGKIGRSFIGLVFSLAGYEVVFVEASEDLIRRFKNPHLGDTVFRVGCALTFSAMDSDGNEIEEDRLIRELYKKNGLGYVLEEISCLDPLSVLDNTI